MNKLWTSYTYLQLLANHLASYNYSKDIWDKLWFSCEIALSGKVQYLFFSSFWLVLEHIWFWRQDWAPVYYSNTFPDFPDFSLFPKIVSLKSFSNSRGNSYTPCLLLIIAFYFTCGERKIWQNTKSPTILFPWL